MSNFTLKKLLILFSLLYCTSIYSAWYEAEGEATIIDGDIHAARQLAVKDALLSAMYQGGASVNAVRVVREGILEKNLLTVRTKGEVHDMRLLKEKIEGDVLTVTVASDISTTNKCMTDTYAKTLFIGPFSLQKREHAQLGGVYRTPEEISRRLFYRFKEHSQHIDARHLRTRRIAFENIYDDDVERQMLTIANEISDQYDVQYILFGKISDMSSQNETDTELLVFTNTIKQRNYQLKLYLVDGIKGLTVFRKNYIGKSEWPFEVSMKIDVTGNVFWSSDYGKMIDSLIDDAVSDVKNSLTCDPSLAPVKNVYGDNVMITLGSVNGVRKGDQFKLIQRQYINEQPDNNLQVIFNPSEIIFKVTSVQSDRSILETDNSSDMGNIQIRDLLVPIDGNEFGKTIYQY